MNIKKFLFENTSTKQTAAKNTFWVALSTTLIKIIRAGVIIYAARILGTENYGIFTYSMSLVAIFAVLSDIGLTFTLTRELTKYAEEKFQYLSTTLVVKLGLLIGVILLVALFGPLISKFDGARSLLIIIAVWISLESLRNFFYAIVRSENNMQTEAGLGIVAEIVTTIIIFFVFLKYPSAKSLAIAYMIGSGIGLFITLVFLRNNFIGIYKYFRIKLVSRIIQSAWPFAIMGIFSIFMTNIDSVIIGFFGNASLLGLYGAAQRPISLLYILPGFLSTSLFPIINRFAKEEKKDQLATLIKKSTLISLGLALPIVLGGIIVARPLINATFGYAYVGATLTFQIFLLTLLFVFPGAMFADVIFAKDKQKVFIRSSFLGSITNVLLDLLLIPLYGIAGSAVATLAAQIVMNSIFFMEVRKHHTFNILGGMKKMVIASFVMSITTYILVWFSVPLIAVVIFSALMYVGLLLVMKEGLIVDIRESLKS